MLQIELFQGRREESRDGEELVQFGASRGVLLPSLRGSKRQFLQIRSDLSQRGFSFPGPGVADDNGELAQVDEFLDDRSPVLRRSDGQVQRSEAHGQDIEHWGRRGLAGEQASQRRGKNVLRLEGSLLTASDKCAHCHIQDMGSKVGEVSRAEGDLLDGRGKSDEIGGAHVGPDGDLRGGLHEGHEVGLDGHLPKVGVLKVGRKRQHLVDENVVGIRPEARDGAWRESQELVGRVGFLGNTFRGLEVTQGLDIPGTRGNKVVDLFRVQGAVKQDGAQEDRSKIDLVEAAEWRQAEMLESREELTPREDNLLFELGVCRGEVVGLAQVQLGDSTRQLFSDEADNTIVRVQAEGVQLGRPIVNSSFIDDGDLGVGGMTPFSSDIEFKKSARQGGDPLGSDAIVASVVDGQGERLEFWGKFKVFQVEWRLVVHFSSHLQRAKLGQHSRQLEALDEEIKGVLEVKRERRERRRENQGLNGLRGHPHGVLGFDLHLGRRSARAKEGLDVQGGSFGPNSRGGHGVGAEIELFKGL